MSNYSLLVCKRLQNLLKNRILTTTKKTFKSTTKLEINFKLTHNYDNNLHEIQTNLNVNNKLFEIQLHNRKNQSSLVKQLPFIWLRDFCKCIKCFDHKNEEQSYDLTQSLIDLHPIAITPNRDNDLNFSIRWSDGHESNYSLKELSDYIFENELKTDRIVYWNYTKLINEHGGLQSYDYERYIQNDETLKNVLDCLVRFGAVLIENIPLEIEHTQKALERISYIQETIFGKITLLRANFVSQDSAYSNVSLRAHNDNTYFKNAAGLEAFQLIEHNGTGGETLLVDAFNCARLLKEKYPLDYEFLKKAHLKAIYVDRKQKHHFSHVSPVIQEDESTGQLYQIRYNPYNRYIPNHFNFDETLKYYRAMKRFGEIIQNKSNEFWFKLKPGKLLIFDNYRVLHGRSSFTGDRELLTAYLPRDDWRSKAKVFGLI